jgi:hypothetical protein
MALAALEALTPGVKVRCKAVERDRHGRIVAKGVCPLNRHSPDSEFPLADNMPFRRSRRAADSCRGVERRKLRRPDAGRKLLTSDSRGPSVDPSELLHTGRPATVVGCSLPGKAPATIAST